MRPLHFVFLSLFVSAAANSTAQVAPSCAGEPEPRSEFERFVNLAKDPVPQIQVHLAGVIARLEARDVSHLPEATLASRGEQIARLAEYSAAGSFPRNFVRPYLTPIFIDDDGRACAVGHLMLTSNGSELASEIRTQSNFAYIGEIAVPGVAEWMSSVGLTAEECALIQPSYGPCGITGAGIQGGSTCTPASLNSGGHLATLHGCGSASVTDNSCLLIVGGLPENSVGFFLNARSANALDRPGMSQGTLCLSGSIGRHDRDVFMAMPPGIGGPSTAGWWSGIGLDLTQMPTPAGFATVLPGDTWYFQAWYRDVNPGLTSNLSDVIWITFT